nr:acyl-coenzyme A diphosphatase NUDT19-like [Procambarus clarkii]XP_045610967.1 acyl-coenzyme A diphosphatase NUDT19-like [Procambarus clarkii]
MAGRLWREAATLIIVSRSSQLNVKRHGFSDTDYQLLLLKRNQKSSFMPSAFVFPGGVIDSSDFSQDWLDVFKRCGYTASDLLKEFRHQSPLPEFYANKPAHCILPEVGFRIGAIRETFEESGILLASHLPGNPFEQRDLEQWRTSVHRDPTRFIKLFQELGGCPAVWDLHEWMGWLTPTHTFVRRFDTAFYITFMDTITNVTTDDNEIVGLEVAFPSAILEQCYNKTLWLPPPQIYELSRLVQVKAYEELKRFAEQRGKLGFDRYMPVMIITSNGRLSVLPGDDLYPEEPDYIGNEAIRKIDSTLEELREASTHLNRIEVRGPSDFLCLVNIIPKYGHIPAFNYLQVFNQEKS